MNGNTTYGSRTVSQSLALTKKRFADVVLKSSASRAGDPGSFLAFPG